MIQVAIDPSSGFCGGVIRAIGMAEKRLDEGGKLFSLGAIVHNEEELSRLEGRGLVTIDTEDLREMRDPVAGGTPLLIRAHGEPPRVYARARELGFTLIDCTCPVVLALQQKIRQAHERLAAGDGQIVIFGKIGHPEVLGLVGQVDGDATVVETLDQLRYRLADGTLRPWRDIELFSQTTMSPDGYARIRSFLGSVMAGATLTVHDTICQQVASRHRELLEFARSHDAIVFVSGRDSSNGKVLCELCRSVNIRTWHIGSVSELRPEWFGPDDHVGVCGATSTPKWLLDEVARAIKNLQ